MRTLVALIAVCCLGFSGCTKEPTPGAAKTSVPRKELSVKGSPTKEKFEKATGLVIPPSATGYRSARVTDNELDVTFKIPTADAAKFIADSKLGSFSPGAVIRHPVPEMWDANPPGTIRSVMLPRDDLVMQIELVDDAGVTSVRIVVAGAAQPTTTTRS